MMEKLEELKYSIFTDDDEVKEFLKRITNQLLKSKIKDKTISPLMLTYREFIDYSLKRIFNKIVEELKSKGLKEDDAKLLSAYLIKEDLKKDMIIHKTIASYIVSVIKENHLLLNRFISDMREFYTTPKGKLIYPIMYPFDKNRHTSPIPELKQQLTQIETVKKQLLKMENELESLKKEVNRLKSLISDIKLAEKRISSSILPHLKKIHTKERFKERHLIFYMQKKRFEVLIYESEQKLKEYEKKLKALSLNIQGFKEKHKETLKKEKEIISTIAKNISIPRKIEK